MNSRLKLLEGQDIYLVKKSKQPDHLFNLLHRVQKADENYPNHELTNIIKKQLLKKRVNNILKVGPHLHKISEPVPCRPKKWISPLAVHEQQNKIEVFREKMDKMFVIKPHHQATIQQVIHILDINKKLKYFGEFLSVEFEKKEIVGSSNMADKQSKVEYLTKKYQALQKKIKPKLCIFNHSMQTKLTSINYLELDEFYQHIMRKDDLELMQMLNEALKCNGSFTLTSFISFYDLFVWQNATKAQQTQFVCNILMSDLREKSISSISRVIDFICNKINLINMNKSLDNFGEIMKKLIFGDDYEYSGNKDYYLTRKALGESLDKNEECISIFINIFYAG